MGRFLAAVLVVMVILGGTTAAVVSLGLYNVAATSTHSGPVRALIATTRTRSVETRADEIPVPPLEDEQVVTGARLFATLCADCHGTPMEAPRPYARHMNPAPPNLADHAAHLNEAQTYWIIRHGLRMTGMPAFGPVLDENQLWSVTAFVTRLPGMSTRAFEDLRRTPLPGP